MFPSVVNRNEASYARREARTAFASLYQQGWFHQLWSSVTGRRHALLNLYAVQGRNGVQTRSHAGVCTVPIDRIRGSEGRCNDFDANFRPLKELSEARWISVACARQADVPLPLVELIQVNDTYFVRDGHHRISVARWLGQQEIEAEVTVWHCRESAAVSDVQPSVHASSVAMRQQPVFVHGLLTNVSVWLAAAAHKLQTLVPAEPKRTAVQES